MRGKSDAELMFRVQSRSLVEVYADVFQLPFSFVVGTVRVLKGDGDEGNASLMSR